MLSPVNSDWNDDTLLLQQLERGSKNAFNILFEKYWEKVYSTAHKRIKDVDAAEDIVQDIFTHIWLNRETLHIINLPAYLNRAVRNQIIKHAAKQKKIHPFFDLLENMPSSAMRPESDLLWKEFYKSYESLLSTLPPQRQIIFRLRFHDDVPTKDISSLLGLSRKTVQNQLGKAIEKLRISLLQLLTILLFFFF